MDKMEALIEAISEILASDTRLRPLDRHRLEQMRTRWLILLMEARREKTIRFKISSSGKGRSKSE